VGPDLDDSVVDVRSFLEQLATNGNRDDMALGDTEPAINLDVKIHCQIRSNETSAHRVSGLNTIDLQREFLDPPAIGGRRPGIDQLIEGRPKDVPRSLETAHSGSIKVTATANAAGIEEMASERWCHALATSAGERTSRPTLAVHR